MELSGKTYEGLIVLLSLVIALGFGLAAVRFPSRRTPAEFFLGDRSFGAWTIGVTLFAGVCWNFMPMAFVTGSAFSPVLLLALSFAFGLLIVGFTSSRISRETKFFTVPEVLGKRIGPNAAMIVGVLYTIVLLFVRIPLSILLGTRLLVSVAGWEPLSSGLLLVVLPGLLAVSGGFPAVIAAQRVQAIVAMIGLALVALIRVPLMSLVTPFGPTGEATSWIAFACTALILGLWNGGLDQSSVQRLFAARSPRDARIGSAAAAGLLIAGVCALLSGGYAGLAQIDLTRAGIVRGILGASILALGMTSLSADFLSVSTLVTMNVFRRFRHSVDDTGLVLIGRIIITFVVLVSILVASTLLLVASATVLTAVHAIILLVSPIVAVSILTLSWSGIRPVPVIVSLVVGWVLAWAHVFMTLGTAVNLDATVLLSLAIFVVVGFLCVGMSFILSRRILPESHETAMIDKRLEVRKS